MSIDLDINNYSITDLFGFFKLDEDKCTYTDVASCANKMSINISSMMDISPVYKVGLLDFISEAKSRLYQTMVKPNNNINSNKLLPTERNDNLVGPSSNSFNPSTTNILPSTNNTSYNNVGKIINPMATSHQSLQKASIPSDSTNAYSGNKFVTNYVFNTQLRDNFYTSFPEDCSFTLPIKLKNVIAISLSAVQIPNVMLAFSPNRGTNDIYIKEDGTGLEGVITIPKGNYDATTFPLILEKAINIQLIGIWPSRFTVNIDPFTYFTTISNSVNTFTMNIVKGNSLGEYLGNCGEFKYNTGGNPDNNYSGNSAKYAVQPSKFVSTMGYLIGYRKIEYIGSSSYTSESMYNGIYTDYVYFCLNEYSTASQYMGNYGILPTGLIDENILAVIPITSNVFTSTFADNADYIYKTRNYNGPIDIQKISIKLLNPQGRLVNLHQYDFGFNLQVTTIYDIMKPYEPDYGASA